MNILLINYEYPPIGAGAATATYFLARAFQQLGHRITVLTTGQREWTGCRDEDGILVIRCPAFRRRRFQARLFEMLAFVFGAALRLPSIIRHRRITGAIVFFAMPCGPLGVLGHVLSGVPFIISLRGGDVPGNEASLRYLHQTLKPVRRTVLKRAVAVVALSGSLAALAERSDGIAIHCIPNGVDADAFQPPAKTRHGRRVLAVGRFQPQKNLFFLLSQMDILAREIGNRFEVHLVGDGPLANDLISFASRLAISDRLVWHGWCDRKSMRAHYQRADCLVNTSIYEGMSNTLLEAMACGLPVVASKVVGNTEMVDHGRNGFLFELKRPRELRRAVATVLTQPQRAREMGRQGRERVVNKYTWQHAAERYIELLTPALPVVKAQKG
jgi:glycosyltransferase involved in cell wall biosynthesis